MQSSTIAILIAIITFALLISNKFPFSTVSCFAALSMGILIPEMKLSQIYSGFGSSALIMVAGMCIVGDALFQTGAAQKFGEKICQTSIVKTEKRFIAAVVTICTVQSAFMSNSGTIAMWMPIIATIAASSNGKIRSKMVIFPAGTACIVGGGSTLVGSTAQAAANALLMATPGYEAGMGVFDMTKVMFPICIIQVIFWVTIGYRILNWALKPESPDFDNGNYYASVENLTIDRTADQAPKWKQMLSVVVMVGCVIGFILSGFTPFNKYLDIAVVPMIGSTILLMTGCLPAERTFKSLPWDVLVTIGAITVLGVGLSVSGGGDVIANGILNLVGVDNLSPTMLLIFIATIASFLTLFLSNAGVASMLTPIAISLALNMGVSPLPYVIVIAVAVNLAIATPIGTAVNMQILPAGYCFMDFVKVGGPVWIVMTIALCLFAPLVYPL